MSSNTGQAQNSETDGLTLTPQEMISSERNPEDRYLASITVVSSTLSTRTIDFSGSNLYLQNDIDDPVSPGDKIDITGSTAADGRWTVESITDDDTLVVVEDIPDSTGGTADFIHEAGCHRTGYVGAVPNAETVCQAVETVYNDSATTIPPMFISESPSSAPEIFGFRDQSYQPTRKIRLAGLFLYTRKTGGAAKDIRARIFKWDGTLATGQLAFIVRLDNVTGAQAISDVSRILQTAGADIIDPDLGDRVYGRIDDGSGSDTIDNSGNQPDPKFAQINYIPETGPI